MPRKSKAALSIMGKKITLKAKSIRQLHPGMKWSMAMKKAGKALKGKL